MSKWSDLSKRFYGRPLPEFGVEVLEELERSMERAVESQTEALLTQMGRMEARLKMALISIQDTELAAIHDALGHVSADYATLRTGITTLLAEAQANAETDTTKAAIAAIIASANTLDGNIQTDGALANASPAVQAVAQAAAPQTPVADPNAPSSGSAATAASSGSGAGQVGSSAGQAETTQPAGGPSTDASNPGGGPAGQ